MLTILDRYAEFFAIVVLGLSGCSSPEQDAKNTPTPRADAPSTSS